VRNGVKTLGAVPFSFGNNVDAFSDTPEPHREGLGSASSSGTTEMLPYQFFWMYLLQVPVRCARPGGCIRYIVIACFTVPPTNSVIIRKLDIA
jgi:hypothetical protein